MLDAFIIDEIKRRKQQDERQRERPQIEIPRTPPAERRIVPVDDNNQEDITPPDSRDEYVIKLRSLYIPSTKMYGPLVDRGYAR